MTKFTVPLQYKATVLNGGFQNKGVINSTDTIPSLQPDILGEWFVLSSFERYLSIEDVTYIAWKHSPSNMAAFLQRASQDFKDSNILLKILDCIDIDSATEDDLSKISVIFFNYYHDNNKPVPEKIIKALYLDANDGNRLSMTLLAWCLNTGTGIKKNHSEAYEWHMKVYKLVGSHYSLVEMGRQKLYGIGVLKNEKLALNYFLSAAKEGYIYAIFMSSICFLNSYGCEQDYNKAFSGLSKAAKNGYVDAYCHFADCYKYGWGVEENLEEAFKWYHLASEKGSPYAMKELADCYLFASGVEFDGEKAFKLYFAAAEKGLSQAHYDVGFCYLVGDGVNEDCKKAIKWFRLAAEKGYFKALYRLGNCYLFDGDSDKDCRKAVKRFGLKTIKERTFYSLDGCILIARGVGYNYAEAIMWFNLAAEKGDNEAKKLLNSLKAMPNLKQ